MVGWNTRETQKAPKALECKWSLSSSSLVTEAGCRAGSLPLALSPLLPAMLKKHLLNQLVACMASCLAQADPGPDIPAFLVQTLLWP